MLRWWHALIVYIIPFSSTNASYFGSTIASPMVVAEPRESSTKPRAAAPTRRRSRSRHQQHTDASKSSNPEAQARVVPPKASREGWRRQQQRRGWSVVASVEGVFKSALRDLSYCVAGLASAGQGQYNFMRNRLAFGNALSPVHCNRHAGNIGPQELTLQAQNDASVDAVMEVIASDGWEHVTQKFGITVVKKFLSAPDSVAAAAAAAAASPEEESVVDPHKAAKFACVKAVGTLDADAFELYKLFLDNERVHEYNESCQQVRDLERLSPDTKVSWAATPRYGPFKARDFVTVVHYRTLADGTMVVLNRAVEHPAARRGSKYVRAEILIATNVMRPNRADPTKTDFISVTHINPGGIVDSAVGAKIANMLCARAPVNLLVSLERCANTPVVPKINERSV